MSSVYSSRRSSISEAFFHELAKSVPQTPVTKQHKPVFRTVPESPRHNRLLSDHGLDIEILTHKLQLYQLELEEAELRYKERKMQKQKEAVEVAAAIRFMQTQQLADPAVAVSSRPFPKRSTSLHVKNKTFAPLTDSEKSLPTAKFNRSKRPVPLHLTSTSDVVPQEVQSAALPAHRKRDSGSVADDVKRHRRQTTISAGRNAGSKIILISSPGRLAEYDFTADLPPVPQLTSSHSSAVSPLAMSPLTPLPLLHEDQLRRELETFALEEGPNIALSRRSSVASRKRMPAAFVPGPDDRLVPLSPMLPETPMALPELPIDDYEEDEPNHASRPGLTRKKSFFSRFERKNDVDALLDLYMTDQQLVAEKDDRDKKKKVVHKSRRQTFFKRWNTSDTITHRSDKPG